MSAPDVTVVIPTRDRAHLLRDTVESVSAQESVDVEIVIVDDGSADEQAAAIGEIAAGRAQVIRHDRSLGVSTARNRGITAANGPWVAFCDDDDLWTPDKLAGQLDALRASGRRWAYSGAVKFAQGPTVWQVMPTPTPDHVRERLADKCIVPAGASNVVAETTLVREIGGFDEGLRHMADWDLWLRLLDRGLPAAASELAVAYRLHPNAMSLNPAGILSELAVIDTRWRHLRDGRALEAGPTQLSIARSYLRAGSRAQAALSYLRASRHDPRSGLRGFVRSFHPAPPSPAHVVGDARPDGPRWKRIERFSIPPAMQRLLEQYASQDPDPRRDR